jgi:hypothetical protein
LASAEEVEHLVFEAAIFFLPRFDDYLQVGHGRVAGD